MFEELEKKSAKSTVFQILGALVIVVILSAFTLAIKARFSETETCGYSACNDVVSNTDVSQAQLLNCRCQCESMQTLTDDCKQAYACERNETCWKLREK